MGNFPAHLIAKTLTAKQKLINMDKTIIVAIIGGVALLVTNILTAIITSKQVTKREKRKNDSDLKFKIAEFAVENPEKLLQLEKQLAIGIIVTDDKKVRLRKFIMPNNRIQIGRFITSDIVLDNSNISNEHCAIYSSDSKVYIEDLLSTNGTFLNGKEIKSKVELKDGDKIQIEDVLIEYK